MNAKSLVASAGLALCVAGSASGQLIDWAAPLDGDWGLAVNWLPPNVPDTVAETARLGFITGYVVTISGTSYTVGGVMINNPLAEIRVVPTVHLGTTVLALSGGSTNNGVIRIALDATTTNNARLQLNTPGMVLSGPGEVRLEEAGDAELYLNISLGDSAVNGADHTIAGAGRIYGGGGKLGNNGTIRADLAGGMQLDAPVSNAGSIRAVAPGALTVTGAVTQTGPGVMEADATTLTLDNCTVSGNTVRAVNGGIITTSAGSTSVNGISVQGEWRIPAFTTVGTSALLLHNNITNDGLIRLPANAATTNNARLQLNTPGMTLGGGGEVRLEEAGDAEIYLNISSGDSAVNGADHTICGTGRIYSGGGRLGNNGAIRADLAGGLQLDAPVSNAGVIRAVAPGTLTVTSTITQTGPGVMEADDATLTLDNCAISGNTVRAVNGGIITTTAGSTSVSGITVEGEWRIPAFTTVGTSVLLLYDNITNDGLIRLPANAATTNNARLQLNTPGMTLGGGGEVRLEEAGDTELYLNISSGNSAVNGADHTIAGAGRIFSGGGSLLNAGTLAPGAPLGTLSVDCRTIMQPTGVVEIELGGDGPAQRDLLDATGTPLTLGGTLRVRYRDDYVLPACASAVIIRGNLSGTFDAEDLPEMPQGLISVSYAAGSVTIGYIPGDLNGDGLLDFADYLEFLNLYNEGDPRADLNGDGLVDFSDYLEFLNLYNTPC